MQRNILALILVLLAACSSAKAADDADRLLEALAPMNNLQGRFMQKQYAADGALLSQSSGRFSLLRPGYFLWEILQPDAQLIIADPEFVWHYDRDLETVTRRPATGGMHSTPLQILAGDEPTLRQEFSVTRLPAGAFQLLPLSQSGDFKQLTLSLDGSNLAGMTIRDNLDQELVIVFSDVSSDKEMSSADFAFVPPVDADLFYYDE